MITEDYVSYEVAALLKEKGMDVPCFNHYVQKNNNDGTSEAVTVCTHQSAMKWLREKSIEIIVYPFSNIVKENMLYTADICTSTLTRQQGHLRGIWKTYEEAVEAAIKYSLKNLI